MLMIGRLCGWKLYYKSSPPFGILVGAGLGQGSAVQLRPLGEAVGKHLNIRHAMTTPYHPETKLRVEHAQRRVKDTLDDRCAPDTWAGHFLLVVLGLQTVTREEMATLQLRQFSVLTLFLRGTFFFARLASRTKF